MDCSPPGSSVHRILKARTLEWVVISSSRGSSRPKKRTLLGLLHRQVGFLPLAPPGKPSCLLCTEPNLGAGQARPALLREAALSPSASCEMQASPTQQFHGGQDACCQSWWIYYTLGIQRVGGQYPMTSQRVLEQLETIHNEMNAHTNFTTHM